MVTDVDVFWTAALQAVKLLGKLFSKSEHSCVKERLTESLPVVIQAVRNFLMLLPEN